MSARVRRLLTGAGAAARLPERVVRDIEAQQQSSERLISWIQLAIVLTFALLYAVSRKTFDPNAMFAPVPWALAVYLAFTLTRLALASWRRVPAWFAHLSAVADIMLLLALMWSFHLQYEQPAPFYLKAPTLLYAFIFIALRALQFRIRYLLVTGFAAAAGWLVMVWYAIGSGAGDSPVTRDYVEYMTSNRVLLGAEFDKVISITLVTLVLAVAMARSRALLVRSVIEETTAREISRFVPAGVARQARATEEGLATGQGVERDATILFMDLEGFTTLSERLTPTALIAVLNEYFEVIGKPLVQHAGVIQQFQGDAVLVTFNLPDPVEDHAARAVQAALEVRRALADHAFADDLRLRARIGVNTGVVVGGYVGDGTLLGYTVHGDEVNLAARLEQLNKAYSTTLLVSQSTVDAVGPGRFDFQRIDTVTVRGRSRSTEVYTVP